jgi:hypothetical protein
MSYLDFLPDELIDILFYKVKQDNKNFILVSDRLRELYIKFSDRLIKGNFSPDLLLEKIQIEQYYIDDIIDLITEGVHRFPKILIIYSIFILANLWLIMRV